MKTFLIGRVNLDTCLAAAILGWTPADVTEHRPDGASIEELENPEIFCLEAGGAGETSRRNFGYRDSKVWVPPVSMQAFNYCIGAASLVSYVFLVKYAEHIVTASSDPDSRASFPSLSSLISGVRYYHADDPVAQFKAGTAVLVLAAELGVDPWRSVPQLPEWRPYIEAKIRMRQAVKTSSCASVEVSSISVVNVGSVVLICEGRFKIAFAETDTEGAATALYRQGADVAVVRKLKELGAFVKYTIAGNGVLVDSLLPSLNKEEPGWGGPPHGTIIGSPRQHSSCLSWQKVQAIVIAGSHLLMEAPMSLL